MRKALFVTVLLFVSFTSDIWALEKLAVLPLDGGGIEASATQTAYRLLLSEIRRLQKYELVPEGEALAILGERRCQEAVCAIEVARQVGASRVAYGSLNKLGEKIIVQYNLVDVASGDVLLSDDLSALRVEELDQVMKRVAMSIVLQVPAEKTVEVGLVTEQESQELNSRKAHSSWGVAFGYLYPTRGYDDEERHFVWDFRSIYELRNVAVDAVLGGREGMTLNIGLLYLFSRKDYSPFVGAGIGFHSVSHEYYYDYYYDYETEDRLHDDGFELLLKCGLMALRTYDFRVIATLEYSLTFNDYDDHAFVLTFGVMRAGKRVFGIF